MWTASSVINALKNHRQICAKIAIIENKLQRARSGYPDDKNNPGMLDRQYLELVDRRDAVEGWILLLPTEERFLIHTHLIQGLDWAKTLVEYEKMWGKLNCRSERTLKRIQSKAIDRIVICLNQIDSLLGSDQFNIEA